MNQGMFGVKRKPAGTFEISVFAGDKEQLAIAKELAGTGHQISEKDLMAYLTTHTDKLEVIQNMLERARGAKAPGMSQVDMRSAAGAVGMTTTLRGDLETEKKRIMAMIEQEIIGQPQVKEQISLIIDGFLRRKDLGAPMNIGLAGPPGVGKTELFKALALAIHGDAEAFVYIDCSKIKTKHDVANIFGAAAGLSGFAEIAEMSPLSKQNLQAKFQGRRPPLLLLDEVDKIGGGDQAVINEFCNNFGRLLDEGKTELSNSEEVDFRNGIIGIATNFGYDKPDASVLKDSALREFYESSFKQGVPGHIESRVPTIIGFDPHTPETLAQVANKVLKKKIKATVAEVLEASGREFSLKVSDKLLAFLGECGLHKRGARPMVKGWLEFLIHPHVGAVAEGAQDGERWELDLHPGLGAQRAEWVRRFREADGKTPSGVTNENFPLVYHCTNPKPVFAEYAGKVPFDPDTVAVAASGAVGGRGFVVARDFDAPKMYLLESGSIEEDDQFREVKLPDKLANSYTFDLKVANLDDDHLLFYSVNVPPGADKAQTVCYLYDAKRKDGGDPFTPVDAPPIPLVGAAFAGGLGKALLWGGRTQYKLPDGTWFVTDDPARVAGREIESQAMLFDSKTKKWRFIDGGPAQGRVGAAAITKDGKVSIIGGEELRRIPHNSLLVSQTSKDCFEFDLATERFTDGGRATRLSEGVAFSTAFVNASNRIQLLGSASYTRSGKMLDETGTSMVLGDRGWKAETIDRLGYGLAVIPRGAQEWIVGPFRDPDTNQYAWELLRPRIRND